MFEYALVVRIPESEPARWQWKGPGEIPDGGLLAILNRAGKEGWEAVAAGDFGGSPTAEVLLKRTLSQPTRTAAGPGVGAAAEPVAERPA